DALAGRHIAPASGSAVGVGCARGLARRSAADERFARLCLGVGALTVAVASSRERLEPVLAALRAAENARTDVSRAELADRAIAARLGAGIVRRCCRARHAASVRYAGDGHARAFTLRNVARLALALAGRVAAEPVGADVALAGILRRTRLAILELRLARAGV